MQARRNEAMEDVLPPPQVEKLALLHLLGDFQKDRLAISPESSGRERPRGIHRLDRAHEAFADSAQAKANIAKRFHEPQLDQVAEAQLDRVIVVGIVGCPKRIGMPLVVASDIVMAAQPASDRLW